MKIPFRAIATIGIITGALVVVAMPAGCGGSKSGLSAGLDGSAGIGGGTQPGTSGGGGTVASGGTTSSGGIGAGGSAAGGAGGTGAGGIGTGGIGTGGGAGGMGAGGTGLGGKGNGGAGTGGVATGGIGGRVTGGTGAGGIATGGATSLDAGGGDAPAARCGDFTTQADCDLRADCHSVFQSLQTCGCATPGCCTKFTRCAEGSRADCTGPAVCDSLLPYCEAPYVVAYKNACYEGCVQQRECPLPVCPQTAPKNATACGPVDYSCFYEDCTGAGRTKADCSAGTWKVQSAACAAVTCPGGGNTPTGTTCSAGQVCVRTTGGGGAYMITATCTTQTCGSGPMSLSCIQVYYSSCSASYDLSGVVVNCSAPSTCGSGQGGCA